MAKKVTVIPSVSTGSFLRLKSASFGRIAETSSATIARNSSGVVKIMDSAMIFVLFSLNIGPRPGLVNVHDTKVKNVIITIK